MYVIVLSYTAPIEQIDLALADHVEWLTGQYDRGHFLASGPRSPRSGGVILARPVPRADLDAILATDPFAVRDLVSYEVIDFVASKTAPELASLNES